MQLKCSTVLGHPNRVEHFAPVSFPPSSALHEVKRPKVIGRDGWERGATSMQNNAPQEFGGRNLNCREPSLQKKRTVPICEVIVVCGVGNGGNQTV